MMVLESLTGAGLTATVGTSSFDGVGASHFIYQGETTGSVVEPILRRTSDYREFYSRALVHPVETDGRSLMDEYHHKIAALTSEDPCLPTSEVSVRTAELVLRSRAHNLTPDCIGISSDGGAVVQFVREHAYADVELFNCGGVLAVVKLNNGDPEIWEPNWNESSEIEESLDRIEKALSRNGSD